MYGTALGFTAYHIARGRDVDAYSDDQITAKLLVASEWLDARYRSSFPGTKVGMRDQTDEWPRNSAFDVYGYAIAPEIVPTEMINATYEAALRELQVSGSLSADWTPPKYKSVSVDGAVSVQYAQFNDAGETQSRLQIVDEILAPILTGSGASSPYSGAVSRV